MAVVDIILVSFAAGAIVGGIIGYRVGAEDEHIKQLERETHQSINRLMVRARKERRNT